MKMGTQPGPDSLVKLKTSLGKLSLYSLPCPKQTQSHLGEGSVVICHMLSLICNVHSSVVTETHVTIWLFLTYIFASWLRGNIENDTADILMFKVECFLINYPIKSQLEVCKG